VKAVSETANPDTPSIHRREATIVAALPASVPAPRFLWSHEDHGWVVLCFEDIEGRQPFIPWTEPDLSLVITALQEVARDLTPSPIKTVETASAAFKSNINGWKRALKRGETRLDPWCFKHLAKLAELESQAPRASVGETLLHFDIRADNLIIAGDRVYLVDWPWARLGAAFVDWVGMAPSVAMQGGPEADAFLGRFEPLGASQDAVDAVLCSLAGYFVVGALEPPPPGLPTVRAFQAAQGDVAIAWLRRRVGWS
jgi:aminoglycoside phosphotransferase (APT) family kinase protein